MKGRIVRDIIPFVCGHLKRAVIPARCATTLKPFLMRAGHDKTFSWVTHTNRKFSVLRFDTMGHWLPTYRVINERAEVPFTLSWPGCTL